MVSNSSLGGRLAGVAAAAVGLSVAFSTGQFDIGVSQSAGPIDFLTSVAFTSPLVFVAIVATVAGLVVAVGPWD
ncbi:hypothetical protein C453_14923 [Haloferax elongans ATCC BAA-1513]|uniref:Uncharacterized protein n=1 Tax=Haloferax elongans ATCC BAA-1513 TaxID=1230453 RepID=M0HF19_HALEO|nr:hypothetical protein [Haloferax elongans]ELZ82388.1 hypothetical protein C453_14923 [Haloferax elongans ATCC BAA-1513]